MNLAERKWPTLLDRGWLECVSRRGERFPSSYLKTAYQEGSELVFAMLFAYGIATPKKVRSLLVL